MGGGGKAESLPWRGPAGAQRPPHGGGYSASGNERAKPLAFPLNKEMEAISLPQPQRGIQMAPSHGATPPDALPSGHRCCAKSAAPPCPRQREASGRPARREVRVPAGQLKNAAPSGARRAGQSATSENPAHFSALPIVTGTAKTLGLVREVHRAGRRQAASNRFPETNHASKSRISKTFGIYF